MTKSILHHVNLNHLDFCDLRSMRGAIMSHPEPCGELNRPDKKRCQTPYEWYRLTDYPLGRKHIDLSQWGELIFCKPHTQLNNLSWTVLPAAVRSGSQASDHQLTNKNVYSPLVSWKVMSSLYVPLTINSAVTFQRVLLLLIISSDKRN